MKRVFVFANGEFDEPVGFRNGIGVHDIVICADGGARHALGIGLCPHTVVGDFDSIDQVQLESLRSQGSVLVSHPRDKDKTDLELALELAAAESPDEIVVCGALGGRVDHLMANILLCARPEWQLRLSIVDGASCATVVAAPQRSVMDGKPGDIFSLIPLTAEAEVSVAGARWPLDREILPFGSTRAVSNEFIAHTVDLKVESGCVLVVRIAGEESLTVAS